MSVSVADPRQDGFVALHFKSDHNFLVFALRVEVHLIAVCVFPAGKVKSIRLPKDFGNLQAVRLRG